MFSQWFSYPQALVVGFPTFSLTGSPGFTGLLLFARNLLGLSYSFVVFFIFLLSCV